MNKSLFKIIKVVLVLFLLSGCSSEKSDKSDFDKGVARLIQDGVRMAEIIVMDDLTTENSYVEYDKDGNAVDAYSIRKVKFPRFQDLDFRPYTKPGGTFDSNIQVLEKVGIEVKSNEVVSLLPSGVEPLEKGDRFIIFFTTSTIDGQDVMVIEGEGLYRIPTEYDDDLNIGRVLLKYYSNATDEQIDSIRDPYGTTEISTYNFGRFTNGAYCYYEEKDITVFELLEPLFSAWVKGKVKFNSHIKY